MEPMAGAAFFAVRTLFVPNPTHRDLWWDRMLAVER
jgi:hypothetical protein